MITPKITYFRTLVVCPLCQNSFERNNNQLPRLLLCGHSCCSNCIKIQIRQKQSMKCPICVTLFPKQICIKFKINENFMEMIDFLQSNYGPAIVTRQKKPANLKHLASNNQFNNYNYIDNDNNLEDYFFEDKNKCKNSQCNRLTDLNFCSQDCKTAFQQAETEKNRQSFAQQ